jgi:hypothetical protein
MPKRKILTGKQKKLLKLLSENIGLERPKTLIDLFREAGYAESVAHQQSTVLAGIRDKVDPIVQSLVDHREKVIKQLAKKLPSARYNNLIEAVDKLTKNIQLLSGKPTDRPNTLITGLENLTDDQLDDIITNRKNRTGTRAH